MGPSSLASGRTLENQTANPQEILGLQSAVELVKIPFSNREPRSFIPTGDFPKLCAFFAFWRRFMRFRVAVALRRRPHKSPDLRLLD